MDERQRRYLQLMDIPVWQARRVDAVAESPTDCAPAHTADPGAVRDESDATKDREPPDPAAALVWDSLRARVSACTACGLHASRTQTVFGVGALDAELMIIGEAPGADEDRLGEPFVGRAGRLLNSMLEAIGLDRDAVFIANILKCRPPRNRDPGAEETAECMPYLHRQIGLVQPRLLLAVGRIAAQGLLRTTTPIGKLRGREYTFGDEERPLMVTYHPAYLLRSPAEKRRAWDDLKQVRARLDGLVRNGDS